MRENPTAHLPVCQYHWLWDPTYGFLDEIVDVTPAAVRKKLLAGDPRYIEAASHMFFHWFWHGLHYGTSVIEGIRVYPAAPSYLARMGAEYGEIIFRCREHIIERLQRSRLMYPIEKLPFNISLMAQACCDLVTRNASAKNSGIGKLRYLRPIIVLGEGLGVDPTKSPVAAAVLALPWGKYLQEFMHNGGAITIRSPLRRAEKDQFPILAKGSASYVQGAIAKQFARANNAAEALIAAPGALHADVAEASGMNVFCVKDMILFTPDPLGASCLDGYTRRTVIWLAENILGLPVRSEAVSFVQLKYADEVFLSGTATEITPVTMFDNELIGQPQPGYPGPITQKLANLYHRVVTDDLIIDERYLTFVPLPAPKNLVVLST